MTVGNYIKKMRDRKEKARGEPVGRFREFVELNSTSLITVSGMSSSATIHSRDRASRAYALRNHTRSRRRW